MMGEEVVVVEDMEKGRWGEGKQHNEAVTTYQKLFHITSYKGAINKMERVVHSQM